MSSPYLEGLSRRGRRLYVWHASAACVLVTLLGGARARADAPGVAEPPRVTQATPARFAVGSQPVALLAADLNGDGELDLAAANNDFDTVSVLFGAGDGSFGPRTPLVVGTEPKSLEAIDFDGDGALELLTFDATNDAVYLSRPKEPRAKPRIVPVPRAWHIAALEAPQGGRPQLAAVSRHVDVLSPRGGGQVDVQRGVELCGSADLVAIADLDGDGHRDLLVAHHQPAKVSRLLWSGGTFLPPESTALTQRPEAMGAGDVNHDGKTDVVVATSSSLALLMGAGAGELGDPVYVPVAGEARAIVVADFNRDDRDEVMVVQARRGEAGPTAGLAQLFTAQPDGTLRAGVAVEIIADPLSAAAGDFDGDKVLDLAVTSGEARAAFVLRGSRVKGWR